MILFFDLHDIRATFTRLTDVECPTDIFNNLVMIMTKDIHHKPRQFISEL